MRITTILLGLLLCFSLVIANNTAFAFAGMTPPSTLETFTKFDCKAYLKFSYKDYSALFGQKNNLWNKLTFTLIKGKIRHNLKKNPALKLSD